MGKFLRFSGYGVNAPDITINAELVMSWHAIDYNGKLGTIIKMVDGAEHAVDALEYDVRRLIIGGDDNLAQKGPGCCPRVWP